MPPPSRVRLPCLAFNSGKYSDAPILFNLSERKSVLSNMDELAGNTTWATPHGWFLVRPQTPATTFLWNPSNGDKIQLPPLHEDVPADCTCLLSDEPTVVSGGGCLVLLLEMMGPVLWYCRVAGGGADDAGGQEWARHEYDIGSQILYPDETLHEKLVVPWQLLLLLHGLRGAGRDRVPPDAGVQLRGHALVTGGYGVAHSALVLMVESRGQLHMVNLLFEGSFSNVVYEIGVYRMDFTRQEWRRDLEGHAFLISPANFAASRRADECGFEDCVYVAYPWDKGLMIYNIKEGTMKVENIEEAPESGRPLWMLPADP
ncbi:LOW QUALITY PROTEIN: hypothetical protein GQ55_7G336900 [Panicum hallii var. hallii]|uniref:KIB1-4 beta-propeller domain-containing protein n=1 Tax=Panicum hallii var. hallii TaxID=1504633 RepID=A0A2T7D1Z7_9POAL|nr:LOW QUALITY PROTEIN: hypothetical protein GQ55_7G336900 [Panicum hallii var. hallii]